MPKKVKIGILMIFFFDRDNFYDPLAKNTF